jgi:formylglycine-generating enzyme required for sulfatase activity
MSSSGSQDIADLMIHLKQVGLDLSAAEMADALWLTLEISKRSSYSAVSAPLSESDQIDDMPDVRAVEPIESLSIAPQPSSASLVTEPPEARESEEQGSEPLGSAMPIAIPAASALSQAMQISRSLRPLMRKVKSYCRQMLDEEATVAQIVDQGIQSPVMQAAPERWLELAIVVEETSVFEVWQDTVAEFQQLMERHGAFRDVRAWQLVSNIEGGARLFRRKISGIDRSQPRKPGELTDPMGRRLVLFVSDCTSVGWRSGQVPDLLEQWMKHNPVTILQLLPGRFWERSALGWGDSVWLGATEPGMLNDRLLVEGLPKKRRRSIVESSEAEAVLQTQRATLTLPVVTLDPLSLGQWAKMMVGSGDFLTAGVVLDLNELSEYAADYAEVMQHDTESLTPEQLVQRFRSTASPIAKRLATMMASVPVSWSVIRLIQKNLLPQSSTVHIAEVFLSGLLQPKYSASDTVNSNARSRYKFDPAVRQLLIGAVPVYATEGVMEKVADDVLSQLPETVRRQLSADIERRLGRSPRSFEAFLVPELLDNLPLDDETRLELLPFAEITGEVLRQLGQDYEAVADRLTRAPVVEATLEAAPQVATTFGEFPPLQVFDFEIGTFVEDAKPDIGRLQRVAHRFEVVTIEVQTLEAKPRQSWEIWKRSKPTHQVIIHRQSRQDWQHVETLAEGIDLALVKVPGGQFLMGAPEDELESRSSERPQHRVTISEFYMSKFPVTQAQWRFVAGLPEIERSLDPDPSRFKGADRPVENVSWLDASEFCARLSERTKRLYRLPSEAEWEYACRADTTTPFHFGETIDAKIANYRAQDQKIGDTKYSGKYGQGQLGEYREQTTPVGSLRSANKFGLFDMHGNVWEWCADHWHDSYQNAPNDGSAWIDPEAKEDASRVLRGGSWILNPRDCRSASRVRYGAGIRNRNVGFRVVCSAPRT